MEKPLKEKGNGNAHDFGANPSHEWLPGPKISSGAVLALGLRATVNDPKGSSHLLSFLAVSPVAWGAK